MADETVLRRKIDTYAATFVVLSPHPYGQNIQPTGFVVGEGAGILVLEEVERARRRGTPILAELVGYGMSGDAWHITSPADNGDGAYRVMRNSLRDAGLEPPIAMEEGSVAAGRVCPTLFIQRNRNSAQRNNLSELFIRVSPGTGLANEHSRYKAIRNNVVSRWQPFGRIFLGNPGR